MTSRRTVVATAALLILGVGLTGACSSSGDASASGGGTSAASGGNVKLVVAIDPGLKPEARAAFDKQAADFHTANPTSTIEPREYEWKATTFAAELAGGTLPDVYTFAFTDGRALIEQKQVADISDLVKQLPYAGKFNPNIIKNGQDAQGNILALPTKAYGQALHYNRALFTQAGLNPDQPPTTWDEVRADAKAIASKTGMTGYAQMAKDNTGGWILTTLAYTLGGRAEKVDGEKATVTVDSAAYKQALTMVKTMRWTDNSMGSDFTYDWGAINTAFAGGKIGMYVSGSDIYTTLIQQGGMKPDDYGVTVLPTQGSDAGALGGGTLAAVNVKDDDATKAAAVKWIDFYYMQKLITQDGAVRDAKNLAAQNQPVGVPQVPVFDQATYEKTLEWVKDYINVPAQNVKPYVSQQAKQPIIPEPQVKTQAVYGSLDSVVQAVLTDQNANVDSLLAQAQPTIQSTLDAQ